MRSTTRRTAPQTSLTLLNRLRSGDPEAIGDLARAYREPLAHALRRKMKMTAADAEEAVQEVWRILVEDPAKVARFVPSETGVRFRSYLYAFARNVARNMKRKRRPEPMPEGFDAAEGDSALEEEVRRSEARRVLAYLVRTSQETAPERRSHRDSALALLLFYQRDRSAREVADRLGATVERAKYLLEAGRKLAREGLKNFVLEDALSPADFDGLYGRFLERLDDYLEEVAREVA